VRTNVAIVNRQTKHKIILATWLALFFLLGFGVWNFQAGHLMIVAYLILSVIIYGCSAFLARCPRCRFPILLKPVKILGMELYTWSILPPEQCRHCGATLS
jgi:DNA-directed RNA polymerase subunit RPC12/RpoP